jgi:hypothetical protein
LPIAERFGRMMLFRASDVDRIVVKKHGRPAKKLKLAPDASR